MRDRWPLTGRDEELRVIGDTVGDDEYRGIVVAGQAGVGKTRLASEAVAAATGWCVRRVAGTVTGQGVSLGAFARWVDDVDASPIALVRQVSDALTAGAGGSGVLLFVDDAHLLDDLSALVVHHLVLNDVVTVIATVRTGEPAPDAVTVLWKNGLLRRLELQPLSRNESGDLLETALGAAVDAGSAERMYRLSRGNALFLRHLVEHERTSGRLSSVGGQWIWAGTISASPSLVELVEQQIGAVPADIREVVDLVAIAEPIDQTLLSTLMPPALIEAAERRGLITIATGSDAVHIGHPLYGEIRLSQCGPLRLKRLRGRLATAMANADAADPLRLALLWLESDLEPDAAILMRAAQLSASWLDLELAERLARAAVDAMPVPETRLPLAYILFLREQGEEAQSILDALDRAELAVQGFADVVILRAANLLWPLRDPDQCRIVLDDALRLGDAERSHSLRTFEAAVLAMQAEPMAAVAAMAAVDHLQVDDFGLVVGYAAETIALGDLGRLDDATERAAAGYRVLERSPMDSFHGTGLAEFHAFALLAAGQVGDAAAIAEHWYHQYAQLPGMSQSMATAAVGMTALAAGDLTGALAYLDSALASLGEYGKTFGLQYRFRILQTEVLARLGRHDAAVASLRAARDSAHPTYVYVESSHLLAAAWVSASAGRMAEAREISTQATVFARVHRQLAREVLALQAAVQFGDTTGIGRLAELAGEVEGPRAPLVASYARALADDDAVALDAVSRGFEDIGDMLAAADSAAQAACSHRVAGQRGSALTASARARLIAQNCGGAVSPALSAATVPLPFTRREHEIAVLLSAGLSNRDIAETTSLSVRTVEGHIYQASTKAGVNSRAQLSALVSQFQQLGAATDR